MEFYSRFTRDFITFPNSLRKLRACSGGKVLRVLRRVPDLRVSETWHPQMGAGNTERGRMYYMGIMRR